MNILQVKSELGNAGVPFNPDTEIGIMTETPASIMISDILATEVDFFSIGTNDLTQYTLAADRQNPKLDAFWNPHHKAILRMIKIFCVFLNKNSASLMNNSSIVNLIVMLLFFWEVSNL